VLTNDVEGWHKL